MTRDYPCPCGVWRRTLNLGRAGDKSRRGWWPGWGKPAAPSGKAEIRKEKVPSGFWATGAALEGDVERRARRAP